MVTFLKKTAFVRVLGRIHMVQETKEYKNITVGFGATQEEAINNAHSRLPYDLRLPAHAGKYAGHKVFDPQAVEGGQFKVQIGYNLPGQTAAEAGQTQKRPGSHGETDSFAATRANGLEKLV